MPVPTHTTHHQLPSRWPPAKEAYRSLDDFGRVLESVLDALSKSVGTTGADPRVAIDRTNQSIKIFNGSVETADTPLKPMLDVSSGQAIAGFPATINEINGLDIETMKKILISVGVEEDHIAKDDHADDILKPIDDVAAVATPSSTSAKTAHRAVMAERRRHEASQNNGLSNGNDPVDPPFNGGTQPGLTDRELAIKRQFYQLRRQVRLAIGLDAKAFHVVQVDVLQAC